MGQHKIRFVDSAAVMTTSIDKLSKSLGHGNNSEHFKTTKSVFSNFDGQALYRNGNVDLLMKKGIYPYSYMKSVSNFEEKKLPGIEHFFNDLTEEPCDLEEYNNALKVWDRYQIKNLGEWHDVYCLLDVTILADCLERTREILWESYGLDVAHYLSLPMIAFDGVCKLGEVDLEYLGLDEYQWLETAVRGGVCGAGVMRCGQANNPYMRDLYDPAKPSSYISFLDINNLYGRIVCSYMRSYDLIKIILIPKGSAMCESLPLKNYKWMPQEKLDSISLDPQSFFNSVADDGPTGYFFEIDLIVPRSIHNKLNDYPPAPTKRIITSEELSNFQQHQVGQLEITKSAFTTKKLVADLHPKLNYVCHYRNIRRFLQLGLQITKIHRGMQFTQAPWMKKFIEFNTLKRIQAVMEYEKNFYKLLNNAAFGKCIENKRKRQSMSIISTEAQMRRVLKKPTYQRIIEINPEVQIAVKKLSKNCEKMAVYLDKPIAVGVAILDISKDMMYEFHYDYMVPKYGDAAKVVYGDTCNSLVYFVETEDIYKDMQANKDRFDLSEHGGILEFMKDPTNHKRLKKMKDEFGSAILWKFAVAKPKMYAAEAISWDAGGQMVKKIKIAAKGCKSSAIAHQISYELIVDVINRCHHEQISFRSIVSNKHSINTIFCKKKALNGFDTKRFIYHFFIMDETCSNEVDIRLQTPFTLTMAGGTQSGKSTLTARIIKRRMEIMHPPIASVHYCYQEYQPILFEQIKKDTPSVVFQKGLPTDFEGAGQPLLLIIDDLMTDVAKSEDMVKAFTIYSHHNNISIIFLTQNFFEKRKPRSITLNSKYIVALKNPRDTTFVAKLGRQMNGGKNNPVLQCAFEDVMKKPYGYLVIDLSQTQDERFRFRSSLFEEDCIIYTKNE
ncbi:putative DNA polymerase [Folsomia candida]|uniref:Putative DNA polymerase n=1 Tax=Folsomia candida TaxID=158441 RepID=A0A226D393_FOLCA|nr:putative DNA polymerase [Folsomia candida]